MEKCRPVNFATRTETILTGISSEEEKETILQIIRIKKKELSDAQKTRFRRRLKISSV